MNKKLFWAALCLPMAFTACTDEELVEQNIPSGETINVVLNAERPGIGVDSRMTINDDYAFVWEEGIDNIGAAKFTDDDKMIVNYPFTAQTTATSSTFAGKSSIMKGTYLFYYGYQDVVDPTVGLSLNMPAQTYKVADEKTALQQIVGQMKMVSPLIDLAKGVTYEKAQTYALGLEFANLYTIMQINIKPTGIASTTAPKVTKVKLNSVETSSNDYTAGSVNGFVAKATADISGFGDALALEEDGTLSAAKIGEKVKELQTAIANKSIYNETGRSYGASVLTVEGDCTLANDQTTTLYILAPKGSYAKNSKLGLVVETTEGVYSRDITLAEELVLADQIQILNATPNFTTDGTGNVTLPKSFDIYSEADWNDAVTFLTDHAVGYLNSNGLTFHLYKSIAIDNMPIFDITVTGHDDTDVDGTQVPVLTLKKDYTFSADNSSKFTFNGTQTPMLGVAEGATVTINVEPTAVAGGILNNGTLNVNSALSKPVTNYNLLNINAATNMTVASITNGRAYNDDDPDNVITEIIGTVNVTSAAGKAATVTTFNNIVGNVIVTEDSQLTNLNNSTAKAKAVVNGTLAGVVSNIGEIDNYGKLAAESVTNSRSAEGSTIDGTIIVEEGSIASSTNDQIAGGLVVIMNVSDFKALQTSQDRGQLHYDFTKTTKITARVTNVKEYKEADEQGVGITDITLEAGDWTMVDATTGYGANTSKTIIPAERAGGLILNGANLNLKAGLEKGIAVIATSTISTSTAGAKSIKGNITVDEGTTLTIGKDITVNELLSTNNADAVVNGTLNVNAGAKMYFNTAAVGAKGTVKVYGNTNTLDAGEFGKKTTFINKGLVESLASTVTTSGRDKFAGKVSQPENQAGATFKGNAGTFSFTVPTDPDNDSNDGSTGNE